LFIFVFFRQGGLDDIANFSLHNVDDEVAEMVEREVANTGQGEDKDTEDDSINTGRRRRRKTRMLSTSTEDDDFEQKLEAADDDGEQVRAAASVVPCTGVYSPRRAAVPKSTESPDYGRKVSRGIRFQGGVKRDLQESGFYNVSEKFKAERVWADFDKALMDFKDLQPHARSMHKNVQRMMYYIGKRSD
jgi:hypothetical protein